MNGEQKVDSIQGSINNMKKKSVVRTLKCNFHQARPMR